MADVAVVDHRGPRPASVLWAWQQFAAPLSSRIGLGLAYAGVLVFLVCLIHPIALGKNWARNTGGNSPDERLTPWQGGILVVQTILSVETAYLLVTEPAGSWLPLQGKSP